MSNVVDLRSARWWRGARKAESVRVGFQDWGYKYYESLDAALGAIANAALTEGQRAFCIDIREMPLPDETEPEHAQ
jgi:hypothetical protein